MRENLVSKLSFCSREQNELRYGAKAAFLRISQCPAQKIRKKSRKKQYWRKDQRFVKIHQKSLILSWILIFQECLIMECPQPDLRSKFPIKNLIGNFLRRRAYVPRVPGYTVSYYHLKGIEHTFFWRLYRDFGLPSKDKHTSMIIIISLRKHYNKH